MREGAELPVFAFPLTVEIGRAEFRLVFIRVVKFLHPVVRLIAIFLVRTLLVMINEPALLGLVEAEGPPPVLFVVVVKRTLLQIVILRVACTGHRLKYIEIEKRHALHHSQVLSPIVAVLPLTVVWQLRLKIWDSPPCYLLILLLLC